MAKTISNTKSGGTKSVVNSNTKGLAVEKIQLINPNETLVKKEEKSLVVRNLAGKLVRRTDPDGVLDEIYDLIQEGEVFVREEESRIVVRNKAGKLVARKIRNEIEEETVQPQKIEEKKPEPKVEETPPVEEKKQEAAAGGLRDRLRAKHSFLDRMAKGEKVGVAPTINESPTMQVVNADLVEEIDDDQIEEIQPDAEVTELENAVNADTAYRSSGRGSSKGFRANEKGTYVSSGAKNPNEKPNMKGSATGDGLVGNYVLATPDSPIPAPEEKKKKAKKPAKPVKPWVVVVALVSLYVIGMLTYFFVGYNFNEKAINIVLYYIDIGENAKLEYYDGEQFNYNEMKMTYYYSDDKVESFNITSADFAETTIGMGYTLDNEYISALWIDSFSNVSSRQVKVKFNFGNLICYVPVTIYRNKLDKIEKHFEISSLSAGQELAPTLFGVYTNQLIDDSEERIRKVLSLDQFDLELYYEGQPYSLKENDCFDGKKYVLPTELGGTTINYSSGTLGLRAVVEADGFSSSKSIVLYD